MSAEMIHPQSVFDAACSVLHTADSAAKAARARQVVSAWKAGLLRDTDSYGPAHHRTRPPDRPARPDRPELRPPADMPRRRLSGEKGRIALLHAIAHIELNAVDLAFDMIARYGHGTGLSGNEWRSFIDDWMGVGDDEARHFAMIAGRLEALGSAYGSLPAHDGLWQAAEQTADDILARLAIAPMVLEARGLDVTPMMITRLTATGDVESAEILQTIYREEIGHVACGKKWFDRFCQMGGRDPQDTFRHMVETRFAGPLKPPFNHDARSRAGMPVSWYDQAFESAII